MWFRRHPDHMTPTLICLKWNGCSSCCISAPISTELVIHRVNRFFYSDHVFKPDQIWVCTDTRTLALWSWSYWTHCAAETLICSSPQHDLYRDFFGLHVCVFVPWRVNWETSCGSKNSKKSNERLYVWPLLLCIIRYRLKMVINWTICMSKVSEEWWDVRLFSELWISALLQLQKVFHLVPLFYFRLFQHIFLQCFQKCFCFL